VVRAALAQWLREEANRLRSAGLRARILDVGCGPKPYYPFFADVAAEYTGLDVVPTPSADVVGFVEEMPLESGRFDLVLCTQVLEHCDDPIRAVAELRRVTAPGGRVLASTHGVMAYHPSPEDHWRWTHTGLARLFRTAEWSAVTVTPVGGATACLGKLGATYLDLLSRRLHVGFLGKLGVRMINRLAPFVDGHVGILREQRPGALFVNYHVVAEA